MNAAELFDLVEAHRDLEGVGIVSEPGHDDAAVVLHRPTKMATRVPLSALPQLSAEQLLPILTLEREPKVLEHMTRVVGYFSRISNFNQSKIGELKDRIAGNYSFEGNQEGGRQQRKRAVETQYA